MPQKRSLHSDKHVDTMEASWRKNKGKESAQGAPHGKQENTLVRYRPNTKHSNIPNAQTAASLCPSNWTYAHNLHRAQNTRDKI